MKQQIYMPNGHLIFEETNPQVLYDMETLRSMVDAGYTVKIDDKKLRKKKNRSGDNES